VGDSGRGVKSQAILHGRRKDGGRRVAKGEVGLG